MIAHAYVRFKEFVLAAELLGASKKLRFGEWGNGRVVDGVVDAYIRRHSVIDEVVK